MQAHRHWRRAGIRGEGSLRAEIAALAAYRLDAKTGTPLLAKFLATANGVPRLREEDGLRPLFETGTTALEPCVIEADLQGMYADRLAGDLADSKRRTGDVQACSGRTDLTAPANLPAHTALVSFSVDGQMAAMVNQPPYTFQWNTARVPNGTHTVRVDAIDTYGNTVSSQTQTVRVVNKNAAATLAGSADDPAMAALNARLWNLLRLRPCRKVAEWTLAQAALASGDRVSADVASGERRRPGPGLQRRAAVRPRPVRLARVVRSLTPPISLWVGNADTQRNRADV